MSILLKLVPSAQWRKSWGQGGTVLPKVWTGVTAMLAVPRRSSFGGTVSGLALRDLIKITSHIIILKQSFLISSSPYI